MASCRTFFRQRVRQHLNGENRSQVTIFKAATAARIRFGVGNGLRYPLSPWLYERHPTNMQRASPSGRGVRRQRLHRPHLELEPSQRDINLGLGLTHWERHREAGARPRTVFLREAPAPHRSSGRRATQKYQNVSVLGHSGSKAPPAWSSPGDHIIIDANLTYLDFRTRRTRDVRSLRRQPIFQSPLLSAMARLRLQTRDVLTRETSSRSPGTAGTCTRFSAPGEPRLAGIQACHSFAVRAFHRSRLRPFGAPARASARPSRCRTLPTEAVFDYFGVQRPKGLLRQTSLIFE